MASVAGLNSDRVFAAAARRLGRRPRLAITVLRVPRLLPQRLRAAGYRALSWPLAKRVGTTGVVSVVGGSKMLVSTHDSIGRVLAISGVWEPNVTAAFRSRSLPATSASTSGPTSATSRCLPPSSSAPRARLRVRAVACELRHPAPEPGEERDEERHRASGRGGGEHRQSALPRGARNEYRPGDAQVDSSEPQPDRRRRSHGRRPAGACVHSRARPGANSRDQD